MYHLLSIISLKILIFIHIELKRFDNFSDTK